MIFAFVLEIGLFTIDKMSSMAALTFRTTSRFSEQPFASAEAVMGDFLTTLGTSEGIYSDCSIISSEVERSLPFGAWSDLSRLQSAINTELTPIIYDAYPKQLALCWKYDCSFAGTRVSTFLLPSSAILLYLVFRPGFGSPLAILLLL